MSQNKKKLKLGEIKISSFVTELDGDRIKGGGDRFPPAKTWEPGCPHTPTMDRTGGNGEKG